VSGSPKNIQRDGVYVDLDVSESVAFSSNLALTSTDLYINGPAAVQVDVARVQATPNVVTNVTASNRKAIGCYIQAPIGDRTPYRVKAFAEGANGYSGFGIAVGYAPPSPTGSDDQIVEPVYFPFFKTFDDLIFIEPEAEGDTYEDRALCFALVIQGNASGVADYIFAYLSVQNLGVKPPTMQNAVS
jgi:hypothetical protein